MRQGTPVVVQSVGWPVYSALPAALPEECSAKPRLGAARRGSGHAGPSPDPASPLPPPTALKVRAGPPHAHGRQQAGAAGGLPSSH